MKIIFLDIDGVLNNPKCLCNDYRNVLKRECVKAFNKIIDETGADIVISSSWRKLFEFDKLAAMLKTYGVKGDIIGTTPSINTIGSQRGDEIAVWLDNVGEEVESFVILDDDSDMKHLSDYLVKCDTETGLTEKEVQKAIKMLNK